MKYPFSYFTFPILILSLLSACGDDDDSSSEPPPFEFRSNLPLEGEYITDVWEYSDPANDRKYAIVGEHEKYIRFNQWGRVYIIDVSDPENPSITSVIDSVEGFDMKIWQNYLYVANGAHGNRSPDPSAIFDLSDVSNPQRVGSFHTCHNIFIDNRGYLYTEGSEDGSGMNIFNLNNNPVNPEYVWSDQTGENGHDVAVVRNRIYDFHSGSTLIYDAEDPENPVLLGIVDDPTLAIFHHSGWVTEDDNTLFISDENKHTSGFDVSIWDISDPSNPELIGAIEDNEYRSHNIYIKDNLVYMSYYGGGFRVYDVSEPRFPELVYSYDTWQGGDGIGSFRGAFGVYPFSESENIYVSDIDNGLFIFSKTQ